MDNTVCGQSGGKNATKLLIKFNCGRVRCCQIKATDRPTIASWPLTFTCPAAGCCGQFPVSCHYFNSSRQKTNVRMCKFVFLAKKHKGGQVVQVLSGNLLCESSHMFVIGWILVSGIFRNLFSKLSQAFVVKFYLNKIFKGQLLFRAIS